MPGLGDKAQHHGQGQGYSLSALFAQNWPQTAGQHPGQGKGGEQQVQIKGQRSQRGQAQDQIKGVSGGGLPGKVCGQPLQHKGG